MFKTLEWSSDGTALLATSEDNVLRTFLVPVDLLAEGRDVAQPWLPTSSLQRPENIYSSALYPYFCLQDISTAILLSACASQPIHLHSALFPQLLASFPLIDPYTEAYITPHSLQFSRSGQSFAAGSNSLISIFDLTRPGDGPLLSLPTIPSRRSKVIGGGVGMKGIIATLDESHDGMLAAGTFTRWIGLYAQGGKGECIATWSLQGESGNGVSQVLWDKADARYLYVAERNSDEITVYDIRKTGRQVGRLLGRRATSNQRLQIGQVLSSSGPELHAGGLDGVCQAWKAPWVVNGDKMPDWCWQAHDGIVIPSNYFSPYYRVRPLTTASMTYRSSHGSLRPLHGCRLSYLIRSKEYLTDASVARRRRS